MNKPPQSAVSLINILRKECLVDFMRSSDRKKVEDELNEWGSQLVEYTLENVADLEKIPIEYYEDLKQTILNELNIKP